MNIKEINSDNFPELTDILENEAGIKLEDFLKSIIYLYGDKENQEIEHNMYVLDVFSKYFEGKQRDILMIELPDLVYSLEEGEILDSFAVKIRKTNPNFVEMDLSNFDDRDKERFKKISARVFELKEEKKELEESLEKLKKEEEKAVPDMAALYTTKIELFTNSLKPLEYELAQNIFILNNSDLSAREVTQAWESHLKSIRANAVNKKEIEDYKKANEKPARPAPIGQRKPQ